MKLSRQESLRIGVGGGGNRGQELGVGDGGHLQELGVGGGSQGQELGIGDGDKGPGGIA